MSLTLVITLLLSVLVGVSLGLLGGGGSILTVPILAYVAGLDAKEAIAASLFVVGVTSAVSVVSHARNGRVRWRTGLVFGAAYRRWGRVMPLVVAHTLLDVVAFVGYSLLRGHVGWL